MKTILYNPIFINPQAYYVFPRLTRYLQPDNESTVEPANYIGTIEVKSIAYGDTTLKRTYSNTDYIDLSEFKNTWIRISLFTKVGSCVLGEWKIGDMQTDLPYIEPEVLASLKAVVVVGNKSNSDSDRAIVRNLVDKDNPFVISNAAFKLNSGFGKYEVDFTSWIQTNGVIASSDKVQNSIIGRFLYFNTVNKKEDVPSFKVNITLGQQGKLQYNYIKEDGTSTYIVYSESGIYTIPASYFSKYTGGNAWFGFYQIEGTSIIEQIPSFEGAFVTDGIDDLITSTKTVQEMLGGSNEITVVSMIHQVKDSTNNVSFTNYIRGSANGYFRNIVNNYDKTGIYGYTSSDLMGLSVVNNILGDKNDYTSNGDNRDSIINGNFSVQGYSYNDGNNTGDFSSVAWYWTIIANKVLTTDQINQVIAYFNLDRTLKPDILCDVKKQGITNENHTEFNNKLIDFSGNGRDIQLNNIAWKGDSGIGKYEVDFASLNYNNTTSVFTATYKSCSISKIIKDGVGNIFYNWGQTLAAINSTKIQVIGLDEIGAILEFTYLDESGNSTTKQYSTDGIYDLPASAAYQGDSHNTNFRFSIRGYIGDCDITITQIPSHAGALLLDGINDFGKVTGMPIYKDYTIVVNKDRISTDTSCILSKATTGTNVGAFITEFSTATYSFGLQNAFQTQRVGISYQSKYVYNGERELTAGSNVDTDTMWLGTIRDNDSRFFNGAIYSLMTFPYSMSEFLIERQLKKHKLGTLYPNKVEFRPVIKSNVEYASISYLLRIPGQGTVTPVIGQYYPILSTDTSLVVYVATNGVDEVANLTINGQEPTSSSIHVDGRFKFEFPFNNSPQKINITIDEYIRYEDIKQPYPVIFQIKDRNTNQIYSWGDKIKVGSSIQLIQGENPNLLSGLYSIHSYEYEGETYTYNQLKALVIIITKSGIQLSCNKVWTFDDNEPKCILSPRLLRIPNSSYKILGHIPDISGHGNHGKINNSAYAGASGANGYKQDFTSWKTNGSGYSIVTDSKYILTNEKAITNGGYFLWNRLAKDSFKVKISNIPNDGWMSYRYKITEEDTQVSSLFIREDGIYTLPATIADSEVDFFISTVSAPAEDWIGLTIEQIGEYEGAYCLDGVDDFVTIPTTVGGKQMLMKVNWNSLNHVLYDQRNNAEAPFCIVTASGTIAYNQRNVGGNTYIDGILNNHILVDDLQAITHNIVLNNDYNVANSNSFIGTNYTKSIYAKMSLYDFMLFDNISTDDKIKELNEYVGVEAKVELPPYYWDTYGKTNSDADRDTIQQRGIAVGDYDLINYNHAYEGMSGYNGYPVVFGANKTWEQMPTGTFTWNIDDNKLHITKALIAGNGLLFSYVKLNGSLFNVKEIPSFKIKVSGLEGKSELWYRYLKTEDAISETIAVLENGTHELPKSYTPSDSLHDGVWIGFTVSPISEGVKEFDCDITIEVLPEYENGLAYDGVEDYSKNANIPAFTDYTYIYKRTIINIPTNAATLLKGADKTNGGAFIADYGNKWQFNFGQYNTIQSIVDGINWQTVNSFNGTSINKGENTDDSGITVSKFSNGYASTVFYKLILYPKTISLLEINFLKNLMEKDEIIDLTNPIFIQE